MTTDPWQQARNILCIRLDYLGDVLMCTPAIRAIKQSGNDRHVTLLSSGNGAAVARFVPEIDAVIEYAAPWMKSSVPHDNSVDLAFIETLRTRNFDAVVIFTTYSQSALPPALVCYLAGIPLRLAHCRENPYQILTHWVPDPEPEKTVRHEVRRQLDLVATMGCHCADKRLSFTVPDADLAWARDRLARLGLDVMKPLMLLHPGATAASRRYPIDHWVQVAARLTEELEYQVVLTGSSDEKQAIDDIRRVAPRTHTLAGELDLGKLGAVISLASVVVSNNTGPAHLAAALHTPLVDLYALTNPQHTPWQVRNRVLFHDVPCRFCYKSICPEGHHHCLSKVTPEQVILAIQSLLQPDQKTGAVTTHDLDSTAESRVPTNEGEDDASLLLDRISEALPGAVIARNALQHLDLPPAPKH